MSRLGCIADTLMGGVDLAATLTRGGLRSTVLVDVPTGPAPEADVLVVALDCRGGTARVAQAQAVAALEWLRAAGCRQFFFSYGENFESTDDGNIGPVADALVAALGCGFALACPARPAAGRFVFQGHLFVGPALLNESGMQRHARTPMHDANLVRVLSRQTDGTVGLVPLATVARGADAIRRAMLGLKEQGRRYAIVDAVSEADLVAIGAAASAHALITGGPGVAAGLAVQLRAAGAPRVAMPHLAGYAAVLAGSCARATLFQVGHARDRLATLELDAVATPDAATLAAQALAWAEGRLGAQPVVIATSLTPERRAMLQSALGREGEAALLADALATIAAGLVALGVRRMLVAGSHASDAIVRRIGVQRMQIGVEIDAGMHWVLAEGAGPPMLLATKPGAAGGRGLFAGAFDLLDDQSGTP